MGEQEYAMWRLNESPSVRTVVSVLFNTPLLIPDPGLADMTWLGGWGNGRENEERTKRVCRRGRSPLWLESKASRRASPEGNETEKHVLESKSLDTILYTT